MKIAGHLQGKSGTKLQHVINICFLISAVVMKTQDSLQLWQGWCPGQSCGTWLSIVAPNALMPCVLSFGSSHILLILLVSARYVMLTVWTHPYSLTFSAPIRMLLMVFQTSLILCGPQPHSQFLTLTPKYPIMI